MPGHKVADVPLQAKQAKLQKELSLRLDPLKLSSQDSINSSPSATIKRRLESSMGRTGPRRMPNAGAHKKVGFRDPDADEDMEDEAPDALDPFAAKQVWPWPCTVSIFVLFTLLSAEQECTHTSLAKEGLGQPVLRRWKPVCNAELTPGLVQQINACLDTLVLICFCQNWGTAEFAT